MTENAERAERLLSALGLPRVPNFDDIVSALEARGAGSLSHARGSFLSHLISTSNILRAWGAPKEVCLAGLAHSAYGTEHFKAPLFSSSEREVLARLIGERAERIVHLFCTVSRTALSLELGARGTLPSHIEVVDRTTKSPSLISREDAVALALVELANAFEQKPLHEPGAPQVLSRFAPVAMAIHPWVLKSTLLDHLVATHVGGEAEAREAYARGLTEYDEAPGRAVASLSRTIELMPFLAEPRLLMASIALDNEDYARATTLASEAFNAAVALGTSWDKAMPWAQTVQSALELECQAFEADGRRRDSRAEKRLQLLEKLSETSQGESTTAGD